jgi:hypothetical protein
MGTHVIWRNPCPPPKVRFKLKRVADSGRAAVYQIVSPNYRHPFEVVRSAWRSVTRKAPEPSFPLPGAELVLARW